LDTVFQFYSIIGGFGALFFRFKLQRLIAVFFAFCSTVFFIYCLPLFNI